VVGSVNMDMVARSEELPREGETLLGESFIMNPGGKGANQAVAAARLGADVTFIGKVGEDIFGEELMRNFRREGIDISFLMKEKESFSGVALILVDSKGENVIVVVPGANGKLAPEDVDKAREGILASHVLIAQLEIPVDTVVQAFQIAREGKTLTILNPAPACELPEEIYPLIDIIVPNRHELARLVGCEGEVEYLGKKLLEQGVGACVVTLGQEGALIVEKKGAIHIPSFKVHSIDGTGAGDAFIAALAVKVAEGSDLSEGVRFACAAGALATTRMGAQQAMPHLDEVLKLIER